MSLTEAKSALRRDLVARILAMDSQVRIREEHALAERFLHLPGLSGAEKILLYVHVFPEEIDTRPMLEAVLDRGSTLICPRVSRKERRLRLFKVQDLNRDLQPGMLRIPEPISSCPEVEPEEVDWALVPGLGFDRNGYRIGRGAGHYDRLLPLLRPDACRIGLLLTAQWVDQLPIEQHDQPLDGVADFYQLIMRSPDAF